MEKGTTKSTIKKIISEELSNMISKLKKANIKPRELSNLVAKLEKIEKSGKKQDILDKVANLIITKPDFKYKLLRTGYLRLSRILAEYNIEVRLKVKQLLKQAESPHQYGQQYPRMAIDPAGKWVAQAGNVSPSGHYRIELYELDDETVYHHSAKEFHIEGEIFPFNSFPQVKELIFNSDGSVLWISVGTRPPPGLFKTWLIKMNMMDLSYRVFGAIDPYEYYETLYSRVHLINMKVANIEGVEKILAPAFNSQNRLVIFTPTKKPAIESWYIDAQPDDRPNYFVRYTDIVISENLLYAAGWAENAVHDGIKNPRASLVVMNLKDRSVFSGPYYVQQMMGYYNFRNNTIWPLKIRPSKDGTGAYLIAELLAPTKSGGPNYDHTGFTYINFNTNKIEVRTDFPRETERTKNQLIRDILEIGDSVYLLLFKRDENYIAWQGLIKLDHDLNLTEIQEHFPENWWTRVYAEPHPYRSKEFLLSAVKTIHNLNIPSGIMAIKELE